MSALPGTTGCLFQNEVTETESNATKEYIMSVRGGGGVENSVPRDHAHPA